MPQLLSSLRTYSLKQFAADLSAGVIVGIIALPLSIAFAIASGVTPSQGIVTAVVAGFLISLLGGSKVQIGGPTGAFVVIVYGIVQQYGMNGLMLATTMAGIFLIVMGVARLGSVIRFVPMPVVTGFTSGIALIIFSSQVKDFLGLGIDEVPAEFIGKWHVYLSNLHTIHGPTVLIALLSLAIILLWPKLNRKIPGSLIAIIVSTALVSVFDLPVETIGARFGSFGSGLPALSIPEFTLAQLQGLISPALSIALLAAIESLLSAMVADGMIGSRHNSNMELIAQGVANVFSPLFGGIPATGAIARTAANIKNGGRTPVSGIVHAVTLLLIMLFVGKWAALIPLASLAAVLMVVAYNMSDIEAFAVQLRAPKSDAAVLLTTFFLTVIFDLTVAIQVGVVLAVFLFMRRMAEITSVEVKNMDWLAESGEEESGEPALAIAESIRGLEVYEINGPFFFGAAEKLRAVIGSVSNPSQVLILRMRHVPALDGTGLSLLREIHHKCRRQGTTVIISGIQPQPLAALKKSGLFDEIGVDNVCLTFESAARRAEALVEVPKESRASVVTQEVPA